mmetsp:Transcript_56793/g.63614  ORF Transcript_56793/g.63614 Transcript_56793/m.63614 type:complete len:507 (+) Transcript_56793:119-1639(+)
MKQEGRSITNPMSRKRRKKTNFPIIGSSLFLGILVIIILFLVAVGILFNVQYATKKKDPFLNAIGNQQQEQKNSNVRRVRSEIRKEMIVDDQQDTQHGIINDKVAVKKLGENEQIYEEAPVSAAQQQGDKESTIGRDTVTIGWAVSITGCGSDPITEGAAVLKHSIHLSSIYGNANGRYNYKMYAIYHPDAIKCAKTLETLGYELVKRETPVAVKDIQGEYLKSKIKKNGCCGEKELVKLEAYTLTQHPIIVHMDLDTLVLKPLDHLFDWMLADDASTYDITDVPAMWPDKDKPKKVNAMFTRDYNMGHGKKNRSIQGGFLVLRPDLNVYKEFVEIIRKGDFRENGGWGGKTGVFYGSMTFQGIVPYYHDFLHPGEAVELDRCRINQMADNPRNKRTVNDIVHGDCMTGEDECEDCRSRPLEDVVTAHFTLCQKPWLCLPEDSDVIQQRLCRKLHHQWHRIRSDLEQSWGRPEIGEGEYQPKHFLGHCKTHSQNGYVYIKEPFGIP